MNFPPSCRTETSRVIGIRVKNTISRLKCCTASKKKLSLSRGTFLVVVMGSSFIHSLIHLQQPLGRLHEAAFMWRRNHGKYEFPT